MSCVPEACEYVLELKRELDGINAIRDKYLQLIDESYKLKVENKKLRELVNKANKIFIHIRHPDQACIIHDNAIDCIDEWIEEALNE